MRGRGLRAAVATVQCYAVSRKRVATSGLLWCPLSLMKKKETAEIDRQKWDEYTMPSLLSDTLQRIVHNEF